jgi:hypothetical protein
MWYRGETPKLKDRGDHGDQGGETKNLKDHRDDPACHPDRGNSAACGSSNPREARGSCNRGDLGARADHGGVGASGGQRGGGACGVPHADRPIPPWRRETDPRPYPDPHVDREDLEGAPGSKRLRGADGDPGAHANLGDLGARGNAGARAQNPGNPYLLSDSGSKRQDGACGDLGAHANLGDLGARGSREGNGALGNAGTQALAAPDGHEDIGIKNRGNPSLLCSTVKVCDPGNRCCVGISIIISTAKPEFELRTVLPPLPCNPTIRRLLGSIPQVASTKEEDRRRRGSLTGSAGCCIMG